MNPAFDLTDQLMDFPLLAFKQILKKHGCHLTRPLPVGPGQCLHQYAQFLISAVSGIAEPRKINGRCQFEAAAPGVFRRQIIRFHGRTEPLKDMGDLLFLSHIAHKRIAELTKDILENILASPVPVHRTKLLKFLPLMFQRKNRVIVRNIQISQTLLDTAPDDPRSGLQLIIQYLHKLFCQFFLLTPFIAEKSNGDPPLFIRKSNSSLLLIDHSNTDTFHGLDPEPVTVQIIVTCHPGKQNPDPHRLAFLKLKLFLKHLRPFLRVFFAHHQ